MSQNYFDALMDSVRPARNPEGTGAVMTAMQGFYSTVDLKSLSSSAKNELKALATKEGKELTVKPLVDTTGHMSTFINWNIFLMARPAMSMIASMNDAFALNLHAEKTNQLNVMRSSNEDDKDEKIEDLIELIQTQSSDMWYAVIMDRYVLKESEAGYEVRFTLGSNPKVLRSLQQLCQRTFNWKNIEFTAQDLRRTNPSLFNDMEDDAAFAISKIEKILGTSLSSLSAGQRARGVVPFGYDFGSLFKRANHSSGEFEVTASAMAEQLQKKFGKHWELALEVRYLGDSSANTNIAKLSALEIAVLPVLNISREAMQYLTQASDPKKIKISTAHTWVADWLADVHYGEYRKVVYVNSLLDNFNFTKRKEALGIKSYDSRADANGIFVNFEGKFTFAPSTSAVDESTVQAYEDAYEKMVIECALHDEPVVPDMDEDKGYLKRNSATAHLEGLYNTINTFQTCALISNWDLNICASVEPMYPAQLETISIAGGTKANPVGTADLLRSPFTKGLKGLTGKDDISNTNIADVTAGHHMAAVYAYLRINNKIKDLNEFLEAAGVVAPNGSALVPGDFEYGVYGQMSTDFKTMMDDGVTKIGFSNANTPWEKQNVENIVNSLTKLQIQQTDFDLSWTEFVQEFNRFTVFFRIWSSIFVLMSSTLLRRWEYDRAAAAGIPFDGMEESEYYADPYGPVNLLGVVNRKYVVGRAFADICKDMLAYLNSPKNIVISHDATAPKPHMGPMPQLPTFTALCDTLGPFIATFGHHIPNADDILAAGDEERKKFVLDPERVVSPVPGMKGEFQVFKHQNRALQLLDNEPFAAFLDISPGGGKTVIGLTDCLQLMAKGKVKLPLLVAPNNLIKNWIKDLNDTVTDFKFNCIPITGKSVEKWGEEKLAQMIKNAPPNTIFHTDLNFIKDHYRKLQIKFLSYTADIYTNLEWMKQFDWDYILFDESHLLKNAKGAAGGSLQSRLFGELTLRESVKFIRLASGTIIHKDVDDIIGQTRLFDPLIFRTHKEFLEEYAEDGEAGNWTPDAAERIRKHLNRFVAVARAKSRDWAYALPAPKQEHPEKWLVEMDPEFKVVYEHICAKTIEEMQEDDELVKLLKSDGIDDDLLDEITDDDDEGLSGKLNVHLSRLEQFLICPENDPLNGWNGLDFSKLKVPKMDKLVELLDEQFSRKGHGKVIIFLRHIGAVYGVFNRLPEKYKKMSVTYSGSDKDGLVGFRYDDEVQIIIGVEHSMNTGENLQIADRVIRMEIPWAAGDVEQGIARVFRPDFANKYERQYIYDDWIIVNDSLEIPKLCRLISSTIRKVQFDEYGSDNENYKNLPYLPSMSLNLKRFMNPDAAVRRYDQVIDYFDAYHALSNIQYDEFLSERSRYIDEDGNRIANPYATLPKGEMLEGSEVLTFTPLLPHQGFVNDVDGDGLKPFHMWINENRKMIEDPSLITEKPVLVFTEFGYGYISAVGRTRKGYIPQSVTVVTNSGEKVEAFTNALYVVGKSGSIKEDRIKKYAGIHNKASNFDQFICPDPRDTEGLIFRDKDGYFSEYIKGEPAKQIRSNRPAPKTAAPTKAPKQPQKTAVKVKQPAADVEDVEVKEKDAATTPQVKTAKSALEALRERMRNKAAGKPTKPAAKKSDDGEDDTYVPENTGKDGKIRGSLCVVSDSLYLTFNAKDPDTSPLKALKFLRVKPFVGIQIKTLLELNAAISFIESKFTIYNAEEIYELRKRFSKKTKLFNGQYDPTDNKFLALNYKPIKNPKNIKLYYIIEDGQLFLVFNYEAHPVASKALLHKKPVGVADKFAKYDSTLMRSVLSKRAALTVLNKVNSVAEIVNYDEIVEAIGELTVI